MKDDLKEQFEAACLNVINDPGYEREKYLNLKHDKVKLLTLKPRFKSIAKIYIPHTLKGGVDRFPAELIVKISSLMGVYVNDITTLGMRK